VRLLSGNLPRIQKVFGGLVVATALLIAFNLDVQFTAWATQAIPAEWTSGLTAFENSPLVQDQLANLRSQPGPVLSAPAGGPPPDLGQAADFLGATNWINSDPLTLYALKGKVVLVDFWTYSCINCIRTFPYLRDWYAKYASYGFVVIGVHTPEFAFEHDAANVIAAVQRFDITYPVAQDNEYNIWSAYNNGAWPAEYLIDAQGRLREIRFGEGGYSETEKNIQDLLAEAGHPVQQNLTQGPEVSFSPFQTPETYIGTDRQTGFGSPERLIFHVFQSRRSLPRLLRGLRKLGFRTRICAGG
jgi:thiol-disulfide isomerase/thioredoxin